MFTTVLIICGILVAIGLIGLILSLLGAGIIIAIKLIPIIILVVIIVKLIDKIKNKK